MGGHWPPEFERAPGVRPYIQTVMSLNPQVILITGASSGFGQACAVHLASRGHKVWASMRDTSRSTELLSAARAADCEGRIKVIGLDVSGPDSIKAAVSEIMAEDGLIDVLINNAGFGIGGFFEDLSEDDWKNQFDVNFFGVLNVTREVVPAMRPRSKGKIINISSMAAFAGTPCFSAYCSSKWALEGFSECLYMELKPFGVQVALVEPGSYRTKIFEKNARFAENFGNPQSPYFKASAHFRQLVLEHIQKNKRDVNEVVRHVEKMVESDKMPFRNIIGTDQKFRRWILQRVPFKVYASLVNAMLDYESNIHRPA